MIEHSLGNVDIAQELISDEEMKRVVSRLSPNAILSPQRFDDAEEARVRLVKAFANLTVQTREYLTGACDTLIIDQKSGNLPGIFFSQLAAHVKNQTGKAEPQTHGLVASLRLPDRENVLRKEFRTMFKEGTIGDHILIVTEHAISRNDRGLVTFANILKEIGAEFGKDPEIRIAAVSIGKEFATPEQRRDPTLVNNYQWYAGELGYAIGSMAFHRSNTNELTYIEGSARPRILPPEEAGPDTAAAKQDMKMFAQELGSLMFK